MQTPHRAHLSRAPQTICSRVHVDLDRIVGLSLLRLLKVIPSHPCFTAPCLTHSCLRTSLHRFLLWHLVRLPLLSLSYPSRCPSTATLQEGLCLGRLAEQFPLTSHESKSLIEVSSEHTPMNLPSREGSLDTNLDDLATTVDASEVYDTADVGRLTSPLVSQQCEVSDDPFGVSCSLSHIEAWRDPCEMLNHFSSFGKTSSNSKFGECPRCPNG